jgi:ketosteroid isomerase-like protein
MTVKILFAGALSALSLNAFAESDDIAAAHEIANIDSDYSNVSVVKGMPAASVEYFAENGVAFAPGIVNGKKYWAARSQFPGTLIWQPIFTFAAAAADLGYTTGVWELKNAKESAFGHYITIWAKQSTGQWRIALDVGTENSQPTASPPSLQVLASDVSAVQSNEKARANLEKVQHRFADAAHIGVGKAILDDASDDIRVYRNKSLPAVGLVAAKLMLGSENGKETVEPRGSNMSTSGDLAYTYGNYSEERGNVVERGIYLMIWRANMNGDWKLALDLQKKLLPTKNQ